MTDRSENETRPAEPPPFAPDPDLIAEREKGWDSGEKGTRSSGQPAKQEPSQM
jgi:hypothetical protein